jgi:hypothetical protein
MFGIYQKKYGEKKLTIVFECIILKKVKLLKLGSYHIITRLFDEKL